MLNIELKEEKEKKKILEKKLKAIKNSPEYLQNQMEIDSIKNVLINNADVPEKLVNWLIEAVKNNTILECNANK